MSQIRISEEMRVLLKRIRALQPQYDAMLSIEHEPRSDKYLIEIGLALAVHKLESNIAVMTPSKVRP